MFLVGGTEIFWEILGENCNLSYILRGFGEIFWVYGCEFWVFGNFCFLGKILFCGGKFWIFLMSGGIFGDFVILSVATKRLAKRGRSKKNPLAKTARHCHFELS